MDCVFIGATVFDQKFHAYDKTTGKLLWETELPFSGLATPSTYMVNGKQYVVIAAGGGQSSTKALRWCLRRLRPAVKGRLVGSATQVPDLSQPKRI